MVRQGQVKTRETAHKAKKIQKVAGKNPMSNKTGKETQSPKTLRHKH